MMINIQSFLKLLLLLWLSLTAATCIGQDTLRVMYYNLLKFPGSTPERTGMLRQIVSYARPDFLLVCELNSEEGADLILSEVFEVLHPGGFSRAAFIDGPDTDNMLFYDNRKAGLSAQDNIPTGLRDQSYYRVFLKGSYLADGHDTVFVNFFVAHLKASSTAANEQQRLSEAVILRNYYENLTNGSNIIAGGDFNFYGSAEPAYLHLTDSTSGSRALADLADAAGQWHNNPSFAALHTQSTRLIPFGGGITGGLDDRFDFIFVSKDIYTGSHRIRYVSDSYKVPGNCGLHFNRAVTDPPVGVCVPANIAEALYYMSDHLPVYMEAVFTSPTTDIKPPHYFNGCTISIATLQHRQLIALMSPLCADAARLVVMNTVGRELYDISFAGSSSVNIPHLPQGIILVIVYSKSGKPAACRKLFVR